MTTSLGVLFFTLIGLSAAVADPLRGSRCCVFRDALLHTTVVIRGYLLPVSFDQPGPSPPSLTTRFFLAELLLTGLFLVFLGEGVSHHSQQTLDTVVHEFLRRSAVSEILKPPRLEATIIPQSKVTFLFHSDVWSEQQLNLLTMSVCF